MIFKAIPKHGKVFLEREGAESHTMSRSQACGLALELLYAVVGATDYHDGDIPHDALQSLNKWREILKKENSK